MFKIANYVRQNKVDEDANPSTPTAADALADLEITPEEAAAAASLDQEASDGTPGDGEESADSDVDQQDSDQQASDDLAEVTASLHKAEGQVELLSESNSKLHQEKATLQASLDSTTAELETAKQDNTNLRALAERQVAVLSVQLGKVRPDAKDLKGMSDAQLASTGADLISSVRAAFPDGVKSKTPSDNSLTKPTEPRKKASEVGF